MMHRVLSNQIILRETHDWNIVLKIIGHQLECEPSAALLVVTRGK